MKQIDKIVLEQTGEEVYVPQMVNTTWAELKDLRDNGQLVAGMQYRITDYVATTIDPESRSANHPFDIIVVADDERTLNENARAALHEGDTYFAKCKIESWKLKYSLDNDTSRFSWAQQGGEVYTLDLSSSMGMVLQGKLVASDDTTFEGLPYVFSASFQGMDILFYAPAATLDTMTMGKFVVFGEAEDIPYDSITSVTLTDGYGVVYQMIDEGNNEMQYDFKGIQFKRYKITACDKSADLVGTWAAGACSEDITIDAEDYRWCYIFNVMFGDDNKDASVYQYDGEYATMIKGCTNKTFGRLPNGVVNVDVDDIMEDGEMVYSCYSWTCGNDCYSWTLQTLDNCKNFKILEGVNNVNIPFVAITNHQQVAGMKSDGTLRVWNPADV